MKKDSKSFTQAVGDSGDVTYGRKGHVFKKTHITQAHVVGTQKLGDTATVFSDDKSGALFIPDYRRQLYLKPYVCPPCKRTLPLISAVKDKAVVSKFIGRVLFTLTAQLVATLVVLTICYYSFIFCMSYYVLAKYTTIKYNPVRYTNVNRTCKCRKFPLNLICFISMTMSVAFIIGMCTMYWATYIPIGIVICSILLCSIAATVSTYKPYDFTSYFMYLYLLAAVSLLAGLSAACTALMFQVVPVLGILYILLPVLLYCAFIILDLHMILGGRCLDVATTDYYLASAMLYTSVISVCVNFLSTLGE